MHLRIASSLLVVLALGACARKDASTQTAAEAQRGERVALPDASPGEVTLDDVLRRRRSIRSYSTEPIALADVGKLCWAAQGITDPSGGGRTAPSAGALHPLELYVVHPSGLYHYEPREHELRQRDHVDHRAALGHASLDQEAVVHAAVDLVVTAVVSRSSAKYGDRGERYAFIEAGHAGQNVLLEATAMGLGAVPLGGFDDDGVRDVLGVGRDELPVYVIAIGPPG